VETLHPSIDIVVSVILGFFISVMIIKLNLTTGIIPSFNVSAGLLGFFLVRSWTKVLQHFGVSSRLFTRQENTIIQTSQRRIQGRRQPTPGHPLGSLKNKGRMIKNKISFDPNIIFI
jgi:OPT oligopeptide transporter protein